MVEINDWGQIEDKGWGTLLLGNGMSINVSPRFDYGSLYKEAKKRGLIDEHAEAIFHLFDTENFEVALSKLRDTIAITGNFKKGTADYEDCFRSIQKTLGRTVREVHPKKREVPAETLKAIRDELLEYEAIFTTSYDLLIYWALACRGSFFPFGDFFWSGRENKFDPEESDLKRHRTPIYHLHGALHLVVNRDGTTRKLSKKDLKEGEDDLLSLFDKDAPRELEARQLLVTEGSARDKLQAIEANDYLSHVYTALKDDEKDLLIFGHSLADEDRHLIDAINANQKRSVAVSMHGGSKKRLHEAGHRILSKLHVENVYLFHAETHPLGDPELGALDA